MFFKIFATWRLCVKFLQIASVLTNFLWLTAKPPKPKKFSKRSKKIWRKPFLSGFAVRCAIGRQTLRAVGVAPTRTRPNIFTAAVIRIGTPLKRAENARPALIFGVGHRVCAALNGRATKIGM